MRSAKNKNLSKSGFTLIEILVVVALVSILVAIGYGSYGSIRKNAQTTQSMSNLRQWGQALLIYVGDSGGVIPFEGDRDSLGWAQAGNADNQYAWFNVLPPMVSALPLSEMTTPNQRNFMTAEASIFRCPVVQFDPRPSPLVNFSYMMNSQIYHPDAPGKTAANGNDPYPPVLITHLPDPVLTAAFADGDNPRRARGRGRHVDNRHRNQTNIVFFDGSVRRFDSDYLREETFVANGFTYMDNNKPDIIWNPWRGHPLATNN